MDERAIFFDVKFWSEQKELIEKSPILKRTIQFSLMVIDYCGLPDAEKRYMVCKQLLRSATSTGANSEEVQQAKSKADFIHKMKIAAKEADETQYRLTLCDHAASYPGCKHVWPKPGEIQKLLNAILGTGKRKNPFDHILSFYFLTKLPASVFSTLACQPIS